MGIVASPTSTGRRRRRRPCRRSITAGRRYRPRFRAHRRPRRERWAARRHRGAGRETRRKMRCDGAPKASGESWSAAQPVNRTDLRPIMNPRMHTTEPSLAMARKTTTPGRRERTRARDGAPTNRSEVRHRTPNTQKRRTATGSTTSTNMPSVRWQLPPPPSPRRHLRNRLARWRALPQGYRSRSHRHPFRAHPRPIPRPLRTPPQRRLRRPLPIRAPSLSLRHRASSTARR
jgi:hypothetical protein